MKLFYINVVILTCGFIDISVSQTTASSGNLYPGVNVTDYAPVIPDATEKIFTSSLTLTKTFNSVNFVEKTFTDAAASVYSQLQGYNGIRNVVSTESENEFQITYDAVYVFNTLIASSTDAQILAAIGDLSAIITGLESNPTFLSLFTVNNDVNTFSFAGNSLCSSVSCNKGAYISCSESTEGSTITCVSPCKTSYCKNDGICTQDDVDSSPVCACRTQSDLWYLGRQCQTMITLWMIILIAIGVFLLILITIFIFCVCYWRKKKRKERLRIEKEKAAYVNKSYVTENDNIVTTIIRENQNASDYHENPRYREREYSERERSRERHRRRHRSHSDDDDRHHHRHHRRRSDDRSDNNYSDVKKPPADESSYESSSEASENQQQNIADFEIDVSEITTERPQQQDHGTSPIRWLPARDSEVSQEDVQTNPTVGGVNIRERPGWRPSLGPNMFDLKRSREELNHVSDEDDDIESGNYAEVAMPYGQGRFVGETDI